MLSDSEPSSNEGKKLPLPCVNPEHDQLWDTIVKILAQVAACLEGRAETGWSHPDIAVLDGSQDQVSKEIGDESRNGKALGSQVANDNNLIANEWVNHHNSEEVSEAWGPEFMEAVEESTVCIADTPEPQGWAQMKQVLLSHVSIFLVLAEEMGEHETTVGGAGEDSTKQDGPEEETSVKNMTTKLYSVGGKSMWYQCLEDAVENDGGSKHYEINDDITHSDNINELVVARSTNNVDIDHLLEEQKNCLCD